jgi:hypothetical protein
MLERRRRRRAQLSRLDDDAAQAIQAEWSRQSTVRSRIAVAVAIVVALAVLPSGASHPPRRAPITPNPILADTPLAGTEVGGLLRPALAVLDSYIKTYFADSDKYYDRLRSAVLAYLDANPVQLPNDPNVANVLFVTDRHCNIGMDRVIVALAKRFGIKVLVSGGDDDFSGSFAFESACTANLASKSQEAGLTDVFVAGNHDSAQTLEDERDQHIHTLEDKPVTVDGITYVGLPDPRSSRYGQGIQPASPEAQHTLLIAQGEGIGELACGTSPPVVIVAHDPLAGTTALHSSCGKPLLALDGHTHKQAGPTAVSLPEQDETAHQFVGGSTGGAPGEGALDKTLVSRLTVGPLHHHASINVVSIDRRTGALVGVTVCHMTPSQDVTFEQLTVP